MDIERIWAAAQQSHQQGRLTEAEELYQQLLQLTPAHPMPLYMLGCIRAQQGLAQPALDLIGRAAALAPDQPMIAADHARALHGVGRTPEALTVLAALLLKMPGFPPALDYRGAIHWQQGRQAQALADFDAVLAQDPGRTDLLFNTATILDQLGRFEEALARYDRICAMAPGHVDARNSRAWTRLQLGMFDAAIAELEQVTSMAPQFPGGQLNLGFYRMMMGDFAAGLPLYEWRMRLPGQDFVRHYGGARWTGAEDIAGRTLFVHSEQGLGDCIQFCRYLLLLAGAGAQIHFAVPAALRPLLESAELPAVLCDLAATPPPYDFQIPLMSLPLALGTRLDTIPAPPRYLRAEPERVARWRERIGGEGFRIGVAWHAGYHVKAQGKPFPLAALEPVARLPGVRLISLQKGDALRELETLPGGMTVETFDDLDAGPGAFLDTAAIMETLDLVISPDSAPAHLAGALGVPVWVALKHVPDWRWMLERNDSPWYPSMRLFRQTVRGQWDDVFAGMAREIGRAHGG